MASKVTVATFSRWTKRTSVPVSSLLCCKLYMRHSSSQGNEARALRVNVESRSKASRELMEPMKNIQPSRDGFLTPRKMKDSYIKVDYFFSKDQELREEYRNYYGGIRFGKVMEDMDSIAGAVAYKHCQATAPIRSLENSLQKPAGSSSTVRELVIVTASVDRIWLLDNLSLDKDYSLDGLVAAVGTSSIEVVLRLHELSPNSKQKFLRSLATFTMVARNPKTSMAEAVPKLQLDTMEENRLFCAIEERKIKRRHFDEISLFKHPPMSHEIELVHSLFMKSESLKSVNVFDNTKYALMENNTLENAIICHPQERNIYNFMFGGFLMRQAFEIAFANASRYCHGRPHFLGLDGTSFKLSVPIGRLLIFTSHISFVDVERSIISVGVTAEILDVVNETRKLTNTFHFIFEKRAGSLLQLLPRSYYQAMEYLDAKRRVEANICEKSDQLTVWTSLIDQILGL